MMYHVQVVTMGGKTWRSRPFVVEPQAESAEMTVKSAFDGTLRKVFLPRSRIPFVDYDFRAATGDFVPVADRHLHFATVLGGQYSMATLWNRSSSGGTDAPIGAWPDWNNALRTAPARTCGPDGSVSLAFDGVDDFFVLPWETVPQNSGYRMTLELSPSDVRGRISLLSSKMLLNASVEQGVVHVAAPGVKKVSTGLKLEKDRWQCVSFVHYGDRFEVGIDGKTFSAPAKLPASFMSPVAFSAPLRGSGMKPFKGALRRLFRGLNIEYLFTRDRIGIFSDSSSDKIGKDVKTCVDRSIEALLLHCDDLEYIILLFTKLGVRADVLTDNHLAELTKEWAVDTEKLAETTGTAEDPTENVSTSFV